MANLNFQQPPRSIANASLTGRATGGFGGSSLSGHVTPTSGMFPTANYGQTQQPQLSPNRNAQLSVGGPAALSSGGRANLFGQRPFVERRPVQGLGGGGGGGGAGAGGVPIQTQMGNFMQSARGSYGSGGSLGGGGGGGPLNNFHNVFGGNGDVSSTPALLDPSEFPSLTNARGQNDQSLPQTNALQPPGSKPYVGMVKQPTSEQSEFTMSNEDFPALPGTQNSDGTTNPGLPDGSGGGTMVDGTDGKPMNSIVGSGVGGAGSAAGGVGGPGGGIGVGVGGIMGAVGTGVSNMVVTSVASGGPGGNGGGLSPGSMNINVNAATGGVGGLGGVSGGGGGPGGVVGSSLGVASTGAGSAAGGSVGGSSSAASSTAGLSSGLGSSVAGNGASSGSGASSSAALTSTPSTIGSSPSGSMNSASTSGGGGGGGGGGPLCGPLNASNCPDSNENSSNDKMVKTGVQTSPDGKVTNIPASMVNNQFGMVGLLTFIRAAESDPNLVTLALGTDLTGLGLNLNSQGDLHPTFAGPFADQPCRAQDVEFNVPPEYLINYAIRDKLSSPVMKKLQDDLLFFLFYTNIGDIMQLMAAAELHNREWRYHIEEKIWITRIPGLNQYEKNGTKERGTFYYFDAQSWKRLSKVLQIDVEKLEKCPNINALMNINGQSV